MCKKVFIALLSIVIIIFSSLAAFSFETFKIKKINNETLITFENGNVFYFENEFNANLILDILTIENEDAFSSKGHIDNKSQFYNKYDIWKENGKISITFYHFDPRYETWSDGDYEETIILNNDSEIERFIKILEISNKLEDEPE